jgi:hypothetical protein
VVRANRGLLLLDVDGPLNPYAAKGLVRPSGYVTYRDTPDGDWVCCKGVRWARGRRVRLHPGHGALLRGLADQAGLELVWATAWEHAANERVAPAIGLTELPVIEFPAEDVRRDDRGRLTWRSGAGWKWRAVCAYAGGRPLAWLDDELHHADYAEARSTFHRDRAGCPTLLCHVDPRHGLDQGHLEQIRNWAAGLL